MNILIYNYLQPEGGGGGVGVYSTNLAKALQAAGHQVITLSSGDVYTIVRREPRLKAWRDEFERAIILNSPMIAPSYVAWDDFGTYTASDGLDGMPALLRAKYGVIDVFHFQNVEGLTGSFFHHVKAEFPEAKLIYSAHNYSAVCAQVDLWFQERKVCTDYRDGLDCTRCFTERETSVEYRSARRRRPAVELVNQFAPQIARVKRDLVARVKGLPPPAAQDTSSAGPVVISDEDGDGTPYRNFREMNIEICDTVFDHVLAVSERTKQVMLAQGIRPHNVSVSYIGTAHKAIFDQAVRITSIGDQLHIAYLGYMRRSKGFNLLLDVLEMLPDAVARRISLTVAAKRSHDPSAYKRLCDVAPRFAAFRYFDGFTHKTLDTVLEGVNLGIVPPIWEDNLPQVAIEMVSRGIPVLTSDRGGAQEIAGNPDFIFEGGSVASLQGRLTAFSTGEIPLAGFWDSPIRIYSMEQHVEDLLTYYNPRIALEPAPTAPEPAPVERLLSDAIA